MKKTLLTALIIATSTNILAQDFPVPSSAGGKCQALVIVPAKFQERIEQVEIKEAAKTYEIKPAEYEWVEQQVMIRPAREEWQIIPAKYKTVTKEIEVEPKGVEKVVIPPKFTEITDELISRPAYLVARGQTTNAFQTTGEAVRLSEIAEQRETYKRRVVQEPARVETQETEAKYETIETQVLEAEAQVEKVPVDAEYQTIKVRKVVKPAQEIEIEIPAEYAEIRVFDKIADAQMRWEEVLCESSINKATIIAVQRALLIKGYNAGFPDGALGKTTMKALEQFQRDNNLATGGLTDETMRMLGVR